MALHAKVCTYHNETIYLNYYKTNLPDRQTERKTGRHAGGNVCLSACADTETKL